MSRPHAYGDSGCECLSVASDVPVIESALYFSQLL